VIRLELWGLGGTNVVNAARMAFHWPLGDVVERCGVGVVYVVEQAVAHPENAGRLPFIGQRLDSASPRLGQPPPEVLGDQAFAGRSVILKQCAGAISNIARISEKRR
jgi:hypothetical protein